jgi:hypothetical protein
MSLPDGARSLRLLAETGEAIVIGVERELPGWVVRQVARILDAWGRLEVTARVEAEQAAVVAGRDATPRVVAELRRLFSVDAAEQSATPLQLVRSAYREPTAVLAAAGIPHVERHEFDERTWPDDVYGLVPATLGDLGDPELAPLSDEQGWSRARVAEGRGWWFDPPVAS